MDGKAVCKGQRTMAMTRRTELFSEADVGGFPWEREECRMRGATGQRTCWSGRGEIWPGHPWTGDVQFGFVSPSVLSEGGTSDVAALTWPV